MCYLTIDKDLSLDLQYFISINQTVYRKPIVYTCDCDGNFYSNPLVQYDVDTYHDFILFITALTDHYASTKTLGLGAMHFRGPHFAHGPKIVDGKKGFWLEGISYNPMDYFDKCFPNGSAAEKVLFRMEHA